MSKLIIDVWTDDANKVVRALKKIRSTQSISAYPYVNAPDCTQINIETTLSSEKIEDWMMKSTQIPDFIGVTEQ